MRYRLLLAGASALLVIGSGVSVCAQHMAMSRPEAAFAANAAQTQVPFQLFRGTRILFQGTVNGQPASMLLDSGAGMTVVSKEFAQRAGLPDGPVQQVRGLGGDTEGRLAAGVTVTVGPMTLAKTNVLVLDLVALGHSIGRPIDVILGREAFDAGILEIDFPARTMRFAPASGFVAPTGSTALPLTPNGTSGTRRIPVSINDGPPILAVLDLGHSGATIVSKPYWQGDPAIAALPWAPTMVGGIGGRVPKRLVTLPSVTIAGQRFAAAPGVLNEGADDLPSDGANVGIDLLRRFRLAFDYGRSMVYLTSVAGELAKPLPKNRIGMRAELHGDRLKVVEVIPQSPAAQAGWKVDDEVTWVGGLAVGPGYYDDARSDWNVMPAGTRLELVRADGTRMPVVLRDFY